MLHEPDAGRAGDASRRITRPLGTAVVAMLVVAGTLAALSLATALPAQDVSVFGFGRGPVCADVPDNGLWISGGQPAVAHLRPGASAGLGQLVLCASHPTAAQRVLFTLTQAPAVVGYLAVLVLLWLLLRTIRTTGPFAVHVADRLRFLGWFVLAGSLLVMAGRSVALSALTSTLVAGPVPVADNVTSVISGGIFLPLLIGCGLLTLARVTRVGAQMSEDLAGTV